MNDIIPNKYILVYGEGTYNDHWNDGKGDIRKDAIVFVVDSENGNAIYTHGYKFGGGSQNNESQNGGSQLPSEQQGDNTSGKKTVYYGTAVQNASTSQLLQLSTVSKSGIVGKYTFSNSTSGNWFYILVPREWQENFEENCEAYMGGLSFDLLSYLAGSTEGYVAYTNGKGLGVLLNVEVIIKTL